MVDWSNQRQVIDYIKWVLQDLVRIDDILPYDINKYYDKTEVTNERNVTFNRFTTLLEELDTLDTPVRLLRGEQIEVTLQHHEISRTIQMLRDQGINPME